MGGFPSSFGAVFFARFGFNWAFCLKEPPEKLWRAAASFRVLALEY